MFFYNHFLNILRLFDVLSNFPFTTRETMRDYQLQTRHIQLPHELPNNLRLRILGNQEILRKCLNFIEYQASAQSSCKSVNANTSKKFPEISNYTVPVACLFPVKVRVSFKYIYIFSMLDIKTFTIEVILKIKKIKTNIHKAIIRYSIN